MGEGGGASAREQVRSPSSPLVLPHFFTCRMQINAVVKVTVRTAVPLSQTIGVAQADKVFSRAVRAGREEESGRVGGR